MVMNYLQMVFVLIMLSVTPKNIVKCYCCV